MVAAAGLAWTGTAAPASAAACGGTTGVTVVVDRGALGGGTDQVCIAGGGGDTASSLFGDAGHSLTYAQRQPGFVCRVDGAPASDPCVNTSPSNAYWGLFSSDGSTGTWSYAALGVQSLTVPDGGYVALAWQTGDQRSPGVPATVHSAPAPTVSTATPTAAASAKPSTKPSTKPTATAKPDPTSTTKPSARPSASVAPTPTSAPSSAGATPSASASASPTAPSSAEVTFTQTSPSPSVALTQSATPEPSTSATSTATPVDPTASDATTDGALPGWVVPVVLLALLGAGGAAYAVRRRGPSRS